MTKHVSHYLLLLPYLITLILGSQRPLLPFTTFLITIVFIKISKSTRIGQCELRLHIINNRKKSTLHLIVNTTRLSHPPLGLLKCLWSMQRESLRTHFHSIISAILYYYEYGSLQTSLLTLNVMLWKAHWTMLSSFWGEEKICTNLSHRTPWHHPCFSEIISLSL